MTLLFAGTLAAHPPAGPVPQGDDVVIARVPVSDRQRLLELAREHDVWGWVWKRGYAEIRTDRDRLPADAVIDEEGTARLNAPPLRVRGDTIPGFSCYRTVEATYADLAALAVDHPGLAEWVDYGDSWEKTDGQGGYDLNAIVLTNESIAGPKPDLIIMAAMHARELTTAETATRFAEYLVDGHGTDPDITWLLDHNEIHILPQHNPDGRKRAESGAFWRKNTNEDYCGATSPDRGADLNRNASGMFWGDPFSSSGDECDPTYRGSSAASEPESQAIEAYLAQHFTDQRGALQGLPAPQDTEGMFISLHSYGEWVLYPWEGSTMDAPNTQGLSALGQRMGYLNDYQACKDCLYSAGGTTVDHAYETYGVAAYTYEMGTAFFQGCAAFENTIWPDNLEALLHAAKSARRPYMTSLGPVVRDVTAVVEGSDIRFDANVDDDRYTTDTAGEPVQESRPIAEVRFTLDQPPWEATQSFSLDPADGAFDSTAEAATGVVEGSIFGGGRQRTVFVYARDADGHRGVPTAVFVQAPETIFSDGFES